MTSKELSQCSRRIYLAGFASSVSGAIAGCGGSNKEANNNQDSSESPEYAVTSSKVTDYMNWDYDFVLDDVIDDSLIIGYYMQAENITQNGIIAGSIITVSYENTNGKIVPVDKVVNSDTIEPGYSWTGSNSFAIPTTKAVTEYSIELFVVRPGRDGRVAEKTVEYTDEKFRNNFQPDQ